MAYRKGIVLQLGAISTLVDVESAVVAEESLKTVCVGDAASPHIPTAVKQSLACPACKNDDRGSFKKARVEGTDFTVVEQDEVADARVNSVGATKAIIQLTPHPIEEVRTQTIQGKSTYYLTGSKPELMPLYGLLADTLRRHPEFAFLGLWTPVGRPGLYEIRLFGDTLVMEGRERTESLKIVQQEYPVVPSVNQQQMDQLLPGMVSAFDPATYADTYKANLDALIASKAAVAGVLGEKSAASKSSVPTGTIDLTALLNAQLSGTAA